MSYGRPPGEYLENKALEALRRDRTQEKIDKEKNFWLNFLRQSEEGRLGSDKREEWTGGQKFEAMVLALLRETKIFGERSRSYLAAIADDEKVVKPEEKSGTDLVVSLMNPEADVNSLLAIDLTFKDLELRRKVRRNFPPEGNLDYSLLMPPSHRRYKPESIPVVCGVDEKYVGQLMDRFYEIKTKEGKIEQDPLMQAFLVEILEEINNQIKQSVDFVHPRRRQEYETAGLEISRLLQERRSLMQQNPPAQKIWREMHAGVIPHSLEDPRPSLGLSLIGG